MVGLFQEKFEPIVRIGENIHVLPRDKYFRVDFIEGLPLKEHNFGAIGADATIADQECAFLYMEDNNLAQFRVVPATADVQITALRQPKGIQKWTMRTENATLPNYADYSANILAAHGIGLQMTEFFQFENTSLFVDLYSVGGVAAAKVRFAGFRYAMTELSAPPAVSTPVWVEGYPGMRK